MARETIRMTPAGLAAREQAAEASANKIPVKKRRPLPRAGISLSPEESARRRAEEDARAAEQLRRADARLADEPPRVARGDIRRALMDAQARR